MADYNAMKEMLRREGQGEQTLKFMEMTNPTARVPGGPVSPATSSSESRMVRGAGRGGAEESLDNPGPTRARELFDIVKAAVSAGREFDPDVEREILSTLDNFDTISAGQADSETRSLPGFADYDRKRREYAAFDRAAKK